MRAYFVQNSLGVFAVDESGNVLDKALFGRDPASAVDAIGQIRSGKLPSEAAKLATRVAGKKPESLIAASQELAKALIASGIGGVQIEVASKLGDQLLEKLQTEWDGRGEWLRKQNLDTKPLNDVTEVRSFIRQVAMQIAKAQVAAAASKRDLYAVQAVRAIDDLDKSVNLFAGRIREWYGLHFPELDRLVEKHDTYIRLVANLGHRRNFTVENLEKEDLPKERCREIAQAAQHSMGADIADEDFEWLRSFCNDTLELSRYRTTAEGYVEGVMKTVAPNMTAILGSVLSARLVSIAGGLSNLAKMPSSTVQVLGAEKALFRSLKTGARPPKHGVIFQHAAIHQSPRWQRGKIARSLSGKLAIAARIDAFGGEYVGDNMRNALEKKIAEIQEKYKEPPARSEKPERRRNEPRRRR